MIQRLRRLVRIRRRQMQAAAGRQHAATYAAAQAHEALQGRQRADAQMGERPVPAAQLDLAALVRDGLHAAAASADARADAEARRARAASQRQWQAEQLLARAQAEVDRERARAEARELDDLASRRRPR